MLSRKLRKQLKKGDYVNHPECSHNWIHYAGEQCRWDTWCSEENYNKDSYNVANIYLCTMCQGIYWSSKKDHDIPHYRVRERRKWGNASR